MLTKKIFHRKTKKGTVIKTVREHYLRDDIPCGLSTCCQCASISNPMVLDVRNWPPSPSSLIPQPHLILVDTNIVIHQIDILDDPLFDRIVVPQTVWEEVRNQSPPAYKRMSDHARSENMDCDENARNWYVFVNEFHKDTYVPREPKESANDRNDRAIRKAVQWYSNHINRNEIPLEVVLLTNDAENKRLATESGIQCHTLREYVQGIPNKPELLDKLSSLEKSEKEEGAKRGKVIFEEHRSLAEIQRGLKEGRYKQGSFQVSRENYLEAYVYCEGLENPVFIQGRQNCNRSIQDDIVALEMLPKEEWSCPGRLLKVRDVEDKDEVDDEVDEKMDDDESDNKVQAKKKRAALMEPTGKIIGIIRRNWRPYCGVLLKSILPGSRRHLFCPSERRIPRIRIETQNAELLASQRIIVSIDSWPRDSRYPKGHYVRTLGPLGDKQTENEVLLLEHDIPHGKFSQDVLDCLPKLPWIITPEDEKARTDLRELNICSVDPPGCTDIDDALHCREIEDGLLEVGVHIADVSHFVRPNNPMDKEASMRGTTVYLVDKRIDMLPDLLSSNLCSLRGGEVRFAFSVIWTVTKDAEVLSKKFCKSIIESRAALTYAEAQTRIDDASCQDEISKSLRRLKALSKKLKSKRHSSGALSLASLEIRFNIDSETHDPIAVQEKKPLETTSMVEEFMLLANITVAEKIYEEYPDCAVLRRHPTPALSSYKPVVQAAASRGFVISVDSGKALAESLNKAVLKDNPFFNTMLRILTTRCMTQALYFASGTQEKNQFLHFGLASHIYTHFTSPIRRYADLLVHRLLAAAIQADDPVPSMLDKRKMQDVCNNMNYRHKNAQQAGRSSVLLNTQVYFKEKTEDLEGYILMIKKNAFQILIPKYGLESPMMLGSNSPFTYNEEEGTMSAESEKGPILLQMFDRVRVQLTLDTSDVQHQKLRLKLVEPKIPNYTVEPLFDSVQKPTEEPTNKRAKTDNN